MRTLGIVAITATGARSRAASNGGLGRNGTMVSDDVYTLIVCPSGSALATEAAPTIPPPPIRFSTITGCPRLACNFSEMTRAIVSEALPGDTPETSRTVFHGKVCPGAGACACAPATSAPAASAAMRKALFIPPPSLSRQAQLLRHPVRAAAPVAVGPVVRVVASIFHNQQLHRPAHLGGDSLGVLVRDKPVELRANDEHRTRDPPRRFFQRQALPVLPRLGLGLLVAAEPECLAGQQRQLAPDLRPVVRSRNRDARLDPRLVGRRARRVVAAEAYAPRADPLAVEVGAGLEPVDHRAHGRLEIAADRELVLRLALPRSIERERRHAARMERCLVCVHLLLGRVETGDHDHDRGAVTR